jgi:hypothetical protein
MSAYLGNPTLVNQTAKGLVRYGDLPVAVAPAPTNHPGGWSPYAVIFKSVAALVAPTTGDALPLQLPDSYTEQDVARDREITEFIPDLSSGAPALDDVLVAIEFLCTTWPVMVNEGRGRFLALNLQGVSRQEWLQDPRWSLHRGLAVLRGLPVPLWFLQLADQGLSTWELLGDPPILTEHVEAQFGWMIETHPVAAEWRALYPQHSGLNISPDLIRLLKAGDDGS